MLSGDKNNDDDDLVTVASFALYTVYTTERSESERTGNCSFVDKYIL